MALPDLWGSPVGLPEVQEGSGVPPVVWEAFPEVWKRLKGPPGGPGVVGRPFWRYGRGREALPEVREGV